jgi:hypothetical protein
MIAKAHVTGNIREEKPIKGRYFSSGTDSIGTPVCLYGTAGQVLYECTVYRGWNKQPYNCSKESVYFPVPRLCMMVPDSCSICCACFKIGKVKKLFKAYFMTATYREQSTQGSVAAKKTWEDS